MEKATIKITHKDGKTLVGNGVKTWEYDPSMMDETIIASLIFQTVFVRFNTLTEFSGDFSVKLTMDVKINKP